MQLAKRTKIATDVQKRNLAKAAFLSLTITNTNMLGMKLNVLQAPAVAIGFSKQKNAFMTYIKSAL